MLLRRPLLAERARVRLLPSYESVTVRCNELGEREEKTREEKEQQGRAQRPSSRGGGGASGGASGRSSRGGERDERGKRGECVRCCVWSGAVWLGSSLSYRDCFCSQQQIDGLLPMPTCAASSRACPPALPALPADHEDRDRGGDGGSKRHRQRDSPPPPPAASQRPWLMPNIRWVGSCCCRVCSAAALRCAALQTIGETAMLEAHTPPEP